MVAMTAPFRLRPPVPLERDIHENCADALDRLLVCPPAEWACYPAGAAQLSRQQQARYSRLGLKRGWPDLMICHQGLYGIELKRPGGTLSKTKIVRTARGAPRILIGQADMFPRLIASGGFKDIAIARSVTEMLGHLERWGIPLRGRVAA
jgi:hypothetical protein